MDITFSNGSTVLIKFYDLDPSNNLIDVSCQNLFNFIDACSRFRFVKRVDLSSNRYWIGTIRLINELNYVARSIYQIVAVVKVRSFEIYSSKNTKKKFFLLFQHSRMMRVIQIM